jgi:hypothetical protein
VMSGIVWQPDSVTANMAATAADLRYRATLDCRRMALELMISGELTELNALAIDC